jgi:hypothetical protein
MICLSRARVYLTPLEPPYSFQGKHLIIGKWQIIKPKKKPHQPTPKGNCFPFPISFQSERTRELINEQTACGRKTPTLSASCRLIIKVSTHTEKGQLL